MHGLIFETKIKWWYQKSVEKYDFLRSLTASLPLKNLPGPKWRNLSSKPSFCSTPCLIVVRIVKFILFANRGDVCFLMERTTFVHWPQIVLGYMLGNGYYTRFYGSPKQRRSSLRPRAPNQTLTYNERTKLELKVRFRCLSSKVNMM